MTRSTIDIGIPNLTGKRALVTGASDGIGWHIAARLAAAGADVVLPVRNIAKGDAAIKRMPSASRVTAMQADLASLESISALAARLRSEGAPINFLINNAGIMTPPERQSTVDGHELQFGVNHLGHVALIAELLPLLMEGRARVTSQISVAANQGTINWDDLNWERSYSAMRAYSQSKIAFGLFALELGRRSEALGWGISSNLSHPGVAPTSLLAARPEVGRSEDSREVRLIRWLSARGILVGEARTAALPALMAATTPDSSGRMFAPQGLGNLGGRPGEQKLFSRLRSEEQAARVWDVSQRLTGISFPSARAELRP